MRPLTIAALLLTVGGVAISASAADAKTAPDRPNVVVVMYDDQSWLECSAYGNSSIQTPHFDRVADSGVLFSHAYCSAPSCAPARATVLTGRHFWQLQEGAFIQAWLPAAFPQFPDLLAEAGYHTGYTGKCWGPGVRDPKNPDARPGGKAYHVCRRDPKPGLSALDYLAGFERFLQARPQGAPFYFWVGCLEPHAPHAQDNYKKLGVSLAEIVVPKFLPDTPGVRRRLANYLYEVRYADNTLGQVLKRLEATGELDNTLLIVTADNGTPIPRAKGSVYDWGVHVPLAVMWPGRVPAGRRVDDFVSFADFAPTILEAAGVPVPKGTSGQSLMPLLCCSASGQIDPQRTFTVNGLEWHGHCGPARMIREGRYQYIVNLGEPRRRGWSKYAGTTEGAAPLPDEAFARSRETLGAMGLLTAHADHPALEQFVQLLVDIPPREELYDCEADPYQLTNLADKPEMLDVKQRLREKLEAFQRATNDPRATGEMETFEKARRFVRWRKSRAYKDRTYQAYLDWLESNKAKGDVSRGSPQ